MGNHGSKAQPGDAAPTEGASHHLDAPGFEAPASIGEQGNQGARPQVFSYAVHDVPSPAQLPEQADGSLSDTHQTVESPVSQNGSNKVSDHGLAEATSHANTKSDLYVPPARRDGFHRADQETWRKTEKPGVADANPNKEHATGSDKPDAPWAPAPSANTPPARTTEHVSRLPAPPAQSGRVAGSIKPATSTQGMKTTAASFRPGEAAHHIQQQPAVVTSSKPTEAAAAQDVYSMVDWLAAAPANNKAATSRDSAPIAAPLGMSGTRLAQQAKPAPAAVANTPSPSAQVALLSPNAQVALEFLGRSLNANDGGLSLAALVAEAFKNPNLSNLLGPLANNGNAVLGTQAGSSNPAIAQLKPAAPSPYTSTGSTSLAYHSVGSVKTASVASSTNNTSSLLKACHAIFSGHTASSALKREVAEKLANSKDYTCDMALMKDLPALQAYETHRTKGEPERPRQVLARDTSFFIVQSSKITLKPDAVLAAATSRTNASSTGSSSRHSVLSNGQPSSFRQPAGPASPTAGYATMQQTSGRPTAPAATTDDSVAQLKQACEAVFVGSSAAMTLKREAALLLASCKDYSCDMATMTHIPAMQAYAAQRTGAEPARPRQVFANDPAHFEVQSSKIKLKHHTVLAKASRAALPVAAASTHVAPTPSAAPVNSVPLSYRAAVAPSPAVVVQPAMVSSPLSNNTRQPAVGGGAVRASSTTSMLRSPVNPSTVSSDHLDQTNLLKAIEVVFTGDSVPAALKREVAAHLAGCERYTCDMAPMGSLPVMAAYASMRQDLDPIRPRQVLMSDRFFDVHSSKVQLKADAVCAEARRLSATGRAPRISDTAASKVPAIAPTYTRANPATLQPPSSVSKVAAPKQVNVAASFTPKQAIAAVPAKADHSSDLLKQACEIVFDGNDAVTALKREVAVKLAGCQEHGYSCDMTLMKDLPAMRSYEAAKGPNDPPRPRKVLMDDPTFFTVQSSKITLKESAVYAEIGKRRLQQAVKGGTGATTSTATAHAQAQPAPSVQQHDVFAADPVADGPPQPSLTCLNIAMNCASSARRVSASGHTSHW